MMTTKRQDDLQSAPGNLSELGIQDLREYRAALKEEEDRVSYWRRVLHGKIDVLKATTGKKKTPIDVDDLARVLADTGTGRSRQALMQIHDADTLPDLPGLNDIWTREPDPTDTKAVEETLAALHEAAEQLGEYRKSLFTRIDAATQELVDRYKTDPAAHLDLLKR